MVDGGGADQEDVVLAGGIGNGGAVARVGETVRRPATRYSPLVRAVVTHLEAVAFHPVGPETRRSNARSSAESTAGAETSRTVSHRRSRNSHSSACSHRTLSRGGGTHSSLPSNWSSRNRTRTRGGRLAPIRSSSTRAPPRCSGMCPAGASLQSLLPPMSSPARVAGIPRSNNLCRSNPLSPTPTGIGTAARADP